MLAVYSVKLSKYLFNRIFYSWYNFYQEAVISILPLLLCLNSSFHDYTKCGRLLSHQRETIYNVWLIRKYHLQCPVGKTQRIRLLERKKKRIYEIHFQIADCKKLRFQDKIFPIRNVYFYRTENKNSAEASKSVVNNVGLSGCTNNRLIRHSIPHISVHVPK